jgi:predicted amidophosphoribosyltransferase
MNWLKTSVVACVNLLLPPRCPLSGVVVDRPGMVSAESWAGLVFISSPHCSSCGLPFEVDMQGTELETLCGSCLASPKPYHRARSVLAYNDDSRKLILAFKHGDQTHLTLSFGPWLQSCGKDVLAEADALVPVPLHWVRLVKRRYNQSALLGEDLRAENGNPSLARCFAPRAKYPNPRPPKRDRSPYECSWCFLTQPRVSRESSWKKLGFA